MTGRTGAGDAARADYLRRRRALVRTHHPDVGGDPVVLQRLLAELDRQHAAASTTGLPGPVGTVTVTGPVGRLRRRVRRAGRSVRTRLPRAVPGSRRYIRVDLGPGDTPSDPS